MSQLNIAELIGKKAGGHQLVGEEIEYFVQCLVDQSMDNAQIGAMLMAMYVRGLNGQETADMTRSMTRSGRVLQWPEHWRTVDKHSTGGVGDKVSLCLAPALAACGLRVPMISGRSLGHTGGTLDKLESIPGFNVNRTIEQMTACLSSVGCCIVGQTGDFVPADKVMYSVRDVTSTVDSVPLITSSIISKKAAEGIEVLVLDVKFGRGAFMKSIDHARRLAETLVGTARALGLKTSALLTNMDCPLGYQVGNALEVAEAIRCLRGQGPDDLDDLVCQLGGQTLHLADNVSSVEGYQRIKDVLMNGSALEKFREMMEHQGVDGKHAQELCHGDPWKVLPSARHIVELLVPRDGYVIEIDAMKVALAACSLGSGRKKVTDAVDHSVGLTLLTRVGEQVQRGQPWIKVHMSGLDDKQHVDSLLQSALVVGDQSPGVAKCRVEEVVDQEVPDQQA